jgi:hypothetical protein
MPWSMERPTRHIGTYAEPLTLLMVISGALCMRFAARSASSHRVSLVRGRRHVIHRELCEMPEGVAGVVWAKCRKCRCFHPSLLITSCASELAETVRAMASLRHAVLLANHGPVVAGD